MKFDQAARLVQALPQPHTHPRRGRVLYDHIRRTRPKQVLEMGTARGGSAIFIAAALEANGAGHLTSVDSRRWRFAEPTPPEALEQAGLSRWVTFNRDYSTYTWFLKTMVDKNLTKIGSVKPVYDLIFLDGAKNWSTDGMAVILSEKVLRPDGWLLLDDLGWTYEKNTKGTTHYEIDLTKLSDDERIEPHLRAIFDTLIRTNPAFDEFDIQDDWWGWAHKADDAARNPGGGVLSGRRDARRSPQPTLYRDVRDAVWKHVPPPAQQRVRALRSKVHPKR